MSGNAEELLTHKGVKPTSNRVLVVRSLMEAESPLSLLELEASIGTVDKSGISRALTLFAAHDIVHSIDDGCGSIRYELCPAEDHCTIADQHVHFHCEKCHKTYCLDNVGIPEVRLPEGFSAHAVNYVVKGVCVNCR
ncbi:MAG: transcriptional repressor [Clostridium sp.]|nr:transcriptional repressor [Prevotella sp.]MCM1428860.1 transcriptional repressor [Clostridium sp.]MCM1475239.1 transcriptional repressor [Muribaculaceae bacterium]